MLRVLIFTSVALIITSCSKGEDRLEKIREKGELVVLTRNAATTYYESREGPLGVEYDIAKAFADSLGVKIRFILKQNISDLFSAIKKGDADFIAAGLTRTTNRKEKFLFGPAYQLVSQQVVCRRDGKQPNKIEDLTNVSISVSLESSYAENLQEIKKHYPQLVWQEVDDTDTEELLNDVWLKKIDCTIADSNIVDINRRYFPELSVRFNLTKPESLAWVMPGNDDGLQTLVENWFDDFISSGKLDKVMHRYYGHIESFDYVDARAYQRKIKSFLPQHIKSFKSAAKKYNIDWTLLAAQAYQESHWRPNAKSTTGVRGMMMLTLTTAKELGIKNRLNPQSSIMGGAYYLNKLRRRLPKSIKEPDRTWTALAAYNIGMGHIWDARKLTIELNKNPDLWHDFSTVLPLLAKKKYYTKLKYGYARGGEPVDYVNNIRNYQDVLEKVMNLNSL
jgi:membrane-bound lytic murein transglycosylase F